MVHRCKNMLIPVLLVGIIGVAACSTRPSGHHTVAVQAGTATASQVLDESSPPRAAPGTDRLSVRQRPVVDLHGCETIGAFEERSIAEQRVQAVFVDPKEGPGGPVAIVLGESPEAGDKANRKEQRSPEDGQGVASWENADGRTFVTLTAKRTPKADFEAIAEHISGKGEPPARYIKMTASPSEAESDATRIQGSSCVLDGQFYAVEIAEGTLAGRSLYFGATDPLKVLNEGGHEPKSATGLSIALFGPKQFPIREASEAEWAEMREAAKSYQRRQQPPSSKR